MYTYNLLMTAADLADRQGWRDMAARLYGRAANEPVDDAARIWALHQQAMSLRANARYNEAQHTMHDLIVMLERYLPWDQLEADEQLVINWAQHNRLDKIIAAIDRRINNYIRNGNYDRAGALESLAGLIYLGADNPHRAAMRFRLGNALLTDPQHRLRNVAVWLPHMSPGEMIFVLPTIMRDAVVQFAPHQLVGSVFARLGLKP